MIAFGTGGWRAIIGDEFTKANIQILAKAMARKMKAEGVEEKGIVMGYDRRFLSKETIYWSCEVFAEEGIKVWFIDRSVPTPLVMFYVMKHDMPYGMMVTASHNPAIYNGIKVFTEGGRDANEIQTQDIECYIREVEEEFKEPGACDDRSEGGQPGRSADRSSPVRVRTFKRRRYIRPDSKAPDSKDSVYQRWKRTYRQN